MSDSVSKEIENSMEIDTVVPTDENIEPSANVSVPNTENAAEIVNTTVSEKASGLTPLCDDNATPDEIVQALAKHLKTVENVTSCSIKQIRNKLIDMGIDMSNVEKAWIMSAVVEVSASQVQSEEEDDADDIFDELSEEYKNRFGDVVWAYSFKMWWPSYVFDPSKLSKRAAVRQKAYKVLGKEHCIYFYGTSAGSDFGFVNEKYLKKFDEVDEETLDKYMKQKMSKRYTEQFQNGVKLAEAENALEREERVKWKHPARKERVSKEKSEPKSKPKTKSTDSHPKKTAKKAVKSIKADESESDSTGKTAETTPSMKSTPEVREVVSEKEEPPDSPSEEESEEEFDDDFGVSSNKKRKKIRKPVDKEKIAKKIKTEDENVLKNKKAKTEKSKEKTKLKPSTPSKNVVVVKPGADETVVERGKRLVGLLNMNAGINPVTVESSAKSVKTIEKIRLLELTFAELKETGAAEVVVKLRKHSDTAIAQSAKKLRDYWKEKYVGEATAAASVAPTSSAVVAQASETAAPVNPQ